MRKLYTVIVCSIIIIGICVSIVSFRMFNNNGDRHSSIQTFIYEGYEHDDSINSYENMRFLYETNPNYPQDINENGVIKNDSMAYGIASIVVSYVYGKECLLKESPAHIKLINDSIWSVLGSLREGNRGGTYCVLIERFSGKIIRISHEK